MQRGSQEEIVEAAYQYSLKALKKFMHEQNMEGLDLGPKWTNTRSTTMPMLGTDRCYFPSLPLLSTRRLKVPQDVGMDRLRQ